jgi:hypothetical protein
MRLLTGVRLCALLAVSSTLMQVPLLAAEACSDFSWNVTRERALFAGPALAVTAGADSGSAPALAPERLYAVQLQPLPQVTFVTAPGKSRAANDGYAGLATLSIATPGAYRIAVDTPLWIDVVADGGLMNVKAFQGASGCNAPHKILEFEFAVARQVVLQFSATTSARIRVSITASSVR